MPLLTLAQLTRVTAISGGDAAADNMDLYIPAGYAGPVTARLNDLVSRPCWNWALCGSQQANAQHASSPEVMYAQNAPVDPYTDTVRHAFPHVYHQEPTIGNLWNAARNAAAGAAGDAHRVGFMAAMARQVARANGLQPQANPSPYRIHVTAPREDWYHWQHWALSITHAGRTRFIQTEPNIPISWGYTRIWEANRPGHLEASFFIAGLHQAHIDVIDCFLQMPQCVGCHQVKPPVTGFNSRWHQCSNDPLHHYCGSCGARLQWNGAYLGVMRRTRRCGVGACAGATTLLGDP